MNKQQQGSKNHTLDMDWRAELFDRTCETGALPKRPSPAVTELGMPEVPWSCEHLPPTQQTTAGQLSHTFYCIVFHAICSCFIV